MSLFKSLKSEKNPTNMSWLKKRLAKAITIFKADKESGPKAYASSLPGFYGRYGEPKEVDQKKLLELAESDPDVRACIDAIVDAVTTNGWIIESESEQIKNRVEQYINKNWGEDDFWMFLRNLTGVLIIFDEAYLEVTGDFPRIIAPWTMKVKRDQYGKITGYVQHAQGRFINFEPEEIVWIKLHPLGTRAYGSPITATLRRTLEGQMYAELFIRDAFMRKGVLSKAFILKTGSKEEYEKLKAMINQSSPGSSLTIKGDIEIQDLGHPFRELQILDLLREYRQKIISVSGVPPILLGLEGGENLETSRNQINAFVMMVKSLQRIISAGVTEVLKRRLGVKSIRFQLQEWTNPEQETRLHVMRVQAGIETINEARRALGLEELDHPIANIPLPFLQMAARGGFVEFDLEETIAQLLAQSRQRVPEKSFLKADYWDEYDDKVRDLEVKLGRRLLDFFRKVVEDDSPSPRTKYDSQLKDLLRRDLLQAALQGVFYVDQVEAAPPILSAAEDVVKRLLPVFMDDFWLVVADKKAGLLKPSKPPRNYQELLKHVGEITEEDLYPWQRLDYENRIKLIATTSAWLSFNGAIKEALQKAKQRGEVRNVMLKWVARLDEKTCPICMELHGKTWSLAELDSAGFMMPPIHPLCRCRLIVIKA